MLTLVIPKLQDPDDPASPYQPARPKGRPPKCPDCGSPETRLSRKSGLFTTLARFFSLTRYRCRGCGKRFFAVG